MRFAAIRLGFTSNSISNNRAGGTRMDHTQYSMTARLLHWGMALLILLTIPAGFLMVQAGLNRSVQNALFLYHKNVGVLLLILVVARLIWRMLHPAPPLPVTMPAMQRLVAHLSHGLLYALLVVMPIAGYVRVRAGGFPIEMLDVLGVPTLVPRSASLADMAKTVHYFGAVVITALVMLHFGAALYHLFVRRDGVFQRMWPTFGGRGS